MYQVGWGVDICSWFEAVRMGRCSYPEWGYGGRARMLGGPWLTVETERMEVG